MFRPFGSTVKRKKNKVRESVHISVTNIYGGQGKHHMQLTIHSCSHTMHLICASVKVYTAAASYSGVTNANT